jgi:hypothetical protein
MYGMRKRNVRPITDVHAYDWQHATDERNVNRKAALFRAP